MRRTTVTLGALLLTLTVALMVFTPTTLSQSPAHDTAIDDALVEIPIVDEAVVDGDCSEYGSAYMATLTYADGTTGTIYLQHDSSNLYVCLEGIRGASPNRYGAVYMDPDGDGGVSADGNDFGFRLDIPGDSEITLRGNPANGYVQDPSLDGFWSGVAQSAADGDVVEWMIPTFPGGEHPWGVALCELFNVAVFHHHEALTSGDGWPDSALYDSPRTWQPARIGTSATCGDPGEGRIAYVFRGDRADATSFYNLLTGAGYLVDLVLLGDILSTDFSVYDLIIIADDSGSLDEWGLPGLTVQQVNQILQPEPDVPIIGLGEGGYSFFGRINLYIGWPNGWHGPEDESQEVVTAPGGYFAGAGGAGTVHQLYAEPVNEVGIFLGSGDEPLPPDIVVFGVEPPSPDHSNLIRQGCRHLWGFSGNPLEMTADGTRTFLNAVAYMRNFQCPPEVPTPEECYSIEKVADPPAGTPVAPGEVIEYTINVLWSDDPNCATSNQWTRLIDYVPFDTLFVPGSATGGIAPQPDGALVWGVPPAGGVQTFKFSVYVMDTQCYNQQTVVNIARLMLPGGGTAAAGPITHPVECPDIVFPNDEPPYAEEEIQIHPYPLTPNKESKITVKVRNNAPSAKTLVVQFQIADEVFGIGLDFNTFDTQVVTVPGNSNVIVETTLTPNVPGHGCIQVVVQGTEPGDPIIKTQRNIDVVEDLQPGVPDTLTFNVGNPTGATADVLLHVDNTCPGWMATVSPALLTDMAPGEVREATLTVTPPNPYVLGSGCHIDVQGWIGGQLIGGIRKIDVPPVGLPVDVEPPYMEPEISLNPDPPVIGEEGQICVELQNPLGAPRTVTLDFQVADFGAGVWFTSVGTETVTLPANSIDDYCTDWIPAESGTLHRCIRVVLSQPGYHDQTSQRNINVVEGTLLDILDMELPVLVHNPYFGPVLLDFNVRTYGLGPEYEVNLIRENGQPVPDTLLPGVEMLLSAQLLLPAGYSPAQDGLPPYGFGDEIRIEIDVLMDGQLEGGVAFVLETPPEYDLYLPLVRKAQ